MKILQVKNNSLRAKKYQLRTIVYEDNGQRFVKKQAITKEAITHLKDLKKNYEKLSSSIIDPRIKLAKIIDETEDSLVFEYIDGINLEEKFFVAVKKNEEEAYKIVEEFINVVENGFATKSVDCKTVELEFQDKLGIDSQMEQSEEICFKDISNIDLIFSNVIYKEDEIYLIDYEWCYEAALPTNYSIYRAIDSLKFTFGMEYAVVIENILKKVFDTRIIEYYAHIETQFQKIVTDNNKYNLDRFNRTIISLESQKQHIKNQEATIRELVAIAESLRLKNRAKRVVKKLLGNKLYEIFKYVKNNPYILKKVLMVIKNEGFKGLFHKIRSFKKQYSYKVPSLTSDIKKEIDSFVKKPLISIVMPVYNVNPKWLKLAIDSVENQWYTNWELCICDDKSTNQDTQDYLKSIVNPKIKIKFLDKNLNISGATNEAIKLANGEYIALMDNDDEITVDALYEMVKIINIKDAEFIYSDEDFISPSGFYVNPHFKPDFSPDLLLSHNYITHFSCIKKDILDEIGYFDSRFDGAQDYELFLRVTANTDKIYHIQKVLYHWRMIETSTSLNSDVKPEALNRAKDMLSDTMKKRGFNVNIENANLNHYFRVKYNLVATPLVSIIIPFKDKPELLKMCTESILDKSSYENFEIIGISNNSEEQETFEEMDRLKKLDKRIKFYEFNDPFNYSRINNFAVKHYANGEHIVLLNNDIEIITPDWIESMLEHSQRENVGCVGAKLYYPDNTVQHAGIIIGLGGYAAHSHRFSPRNDNGYFNRLQIVQNVSAVTGACLMVKKNIYEELNGLNEIDFTVAYNDVDFCLRVLKKGYLNIFTPYAEAYHYESISRGYEDSPEKISRFDKEKEALYNRHKNILDQGDPYYNTNLTLDREDFSLK